MGKPKKLDKMAAEFVELDEIEAQMTKLKTRAEEIKQSVRDALGSSEEGTIKGVTVVTYVTAQRSEFDQSAFKAAHPIIAKRFIKIRPVRTMLLKTKAWGEAGLRG